MECNALTHELFALIAILIVAGLAILISPIPQRGALAVTVMACLALSTALTGVVHWFDPHEQISLSKVVDEWLGHIATALITAAVLELFFHARTLHHLEEGWRATLTSVFKAEPAGLTAIFRDRAEQDVLLEACLESAMGADRGALIHRNWIVPYLHEERRFRQAFVNLVEARSIRSSDLALWGSMLGADAAQKYYRVRQTLQYRYDCNVLNSDNQLEIRFVFEHPELESAFRDANVFFRELLQIDPQCREKLKGLSSEELTDVVGRVFRFAAFDTSLAPGTPLSWSSTLAANDPYAEPHIKVLVRPRDRSLITACRIEFALPQLKERPHFLVQLNEPTLEPTIVFDHQDIDVELIDFPFFSVTYGRTQTPMEGPARRIEFKVANQWAFPRSGVLFTWRHPEIPAADPI